MKTYLLIGMGDMEPSSYLYNHEKEIRPIEFGSLENALKWLEVWGLREKFDPEDDRVVIYEILDSGHRKPVWHASGWHWPFDGVDGVPLTQGKLPGHECDVYSEAMKDY